MMPTDFFDIGAHELEITGHLDSIFIQVLSFGKPEVAAQLLFMNFSIRLELNLCHCNVLCFTFHLQLDSCH
jgi:hypothetical protein